MRELNLLPQQRQRHLGTPAAVDLSLQAPRRRTPGTPVRPVCRGGHGERADPDLVAAVPLAVRLL